MRELAAHMHVTDQIIAPQHVRRQRLRAEVVFIILSESGFYTAAHFDEITQEKQNNVIDEAL